MARPIETYYNGYRFRSRLEARWAVFFDALGVSYSYEHQGFNMRGMCYLPDFYLYADGVWLEVKPKGATQDEEIEALNKMMRLAIKRMDVGFDEFLEQQKQPKHGEPVALVIGDPFDYQGLAFIEDDNKTLSTLPNPKGFNGVLSEVLILRFFFFVLCPRCNKLCFCFFRSKDDPIWACTCFHCKHREWLSEEQRYIVLTNPRLRDAVYRGRQARFEHGETPKAPREKPRDELG